ncbi:mucolipin-3-like [Haliotis cracherodii]|uniref:mucolipin-3-like n=1 Tax=Haliotis cracherodii TaxID=6455 RepID=UPI0039EA9A11
MNPSNMQQMRNRSPSPYGRRPHSHSHTGSTQEGGREKDSSSDHHHRHAHHHHDRSRQRVKSASLNLGQRNELESMANIESASVHGSINHQHDDDDNIGDDDKAELPKAAPVNRIPSLYTPGMEDRLRRKLKVFFMDPCSKFRAKRQWPWKLSLQILKIILVTVQLVIFGQQRSSIVQYFERNQIALKHILMKDWNPSYETLPYPPATGQYALYMRKNLLEHINNAMEQYYKLPDIAIGSFQLRKDDNGTIAPMKFCRSTYTEGKIFDNNTFIIDPNVLYSCLELVCPEQIKDETASYSCDIEELLKARNASLQFDRLISIELHMTIRSYHLDLFTAHAGPACFSSDVQIMYDNNERDGQVLVTLNADVTELQCHGQILSEESSYRRGLIIYDALIIILCILSLFLCLRSIYRAQVLKQQTVKFFMNRFGKKLSLAEQTDFLNMWYILIVVNDALTVVGSSFKIQLEDQKFSSSSKNYDIGSVTLGIGCLMAWMGVLRYLGFFEKYNILIITLKKAFPNVLRFLVCTLAIYFGFTFCGWLVLGPYHMKFRHLSTASECLFSLVNGDDMFVTFSATETESDLIWYFSRTYLYVFISLFIYIVLSLFIAVIMDTYETIKHCYEHGFPKTDLMKFIDECTEPPNSSVYQQDHKPCCLFSCIPCCNREDPDTPSERTHLLSQSI